MAQDHQAGLQRFVTAQERVLPAVLDELESGAKRSHWMWFIFPQIDRLGMSQTARLYSLVDLAEARAYLAHAVLGPRLRHCSRLVTQVSGRSAREIFGSPDDMKFRSSMTLFASAAPGEPLFANALKIYFAGGPDQATLDILTHQATS